MKFKDLLRLRRTSEGGSIPEATLRKLELPVPEGVFEQLVRDHAATDHTQSTCGELDLHGIRWEEVRLTASAIADAAVHPHGQDCVEAVRKQAAAVAERGWPGVMIGAESRSRWQAHRTWLTPPLFIEGALAGSLVALRLVEGHQRLGALRGLLDCGWLAADGTHSVWLGREQIPPFPEGPWKRVVRENPIPFADWLRKLPFRGEPTDTISARVLEAAVSNRLTSEGPDAVVEFANSDPALREHIDEIRVLEAEWRAYTGP